ncbi:hypothetical protein FRB99_001635 [Tulasnella sp. 403]|nr:hypothetical protein FRB99_001635 [Tulasnella sp. 403]
MGLVNGVSNGLNGSSKSHVSRPLTPGVYAPVPTFFVDGTEDIDIATFKRHVSYLAKAGMGLVLCGSMGEAHHLEPSERVQLIRAARQVLDSAGLTKVPIIAGTGAGSTRKTIELTRQAAEAGADCAIVIASGYYAGALDYPALKTFFVEVSEASPIPVMIYNYPGAAGGLDLDSDLIEAIAKESSNICGVKLTCGNVGKLVRIATTTAVPAFDKLYPRKNKDAPFLVLGGFADFILPSAFSRAHGAIVGLANVAPRSLARLAELSFGAVTNPALLPEAQRLQDIIARGDRTIALVGISGTKFLLEKVHGYGGAPRRPLQRLTKEREDALWAHENVQALLELERSLEQEAVAASKLSLPTLDSEVELDRHASREVSVSA